MNLGLESAVIQAIRDCVRMVEVSAGDSALGISETDAVQISLQQGCPLAGVYSMALAEGIWPIRYIRHRGSLETKDQLSLAKSTVAVVGCGGLGGHAVTMMARAGIGTIRIVDPDIFEESNLNRQTFATTDTLGMRKTAAIAAAIRAVNPAVRIIQYPEALDSVNASQILDGADVCVDALDNLPDRQLLFGQTRQLKIPLVHAAIAGFEGQIMIFFPDKKSGHSLFDSAESATAESVLGVLPVTPVFFASLQVMKVIQILLKRNMPHAGQMLYADMATGTFDYFDFGAGP